MIECRCYSACPRLHLCAPIPSSPNGYIILYYHLSLSLLLCLVQVQVHYLRLQLDCLKRRCMVWIEWIALEVMDSFDPSHNTPSAVIHPGIKSYLPRSRKNDCARVRKNFNLLSPGGYKRFSLYFLFVLYS